MNRTLRISLVLAIVLALSPFALADTLVGTAGFGWQNWTTTDLNNNGTPYWDKNSFDGANRNIGYCLTNSGNCTVANYPAWTDRPGALPYWGSTTGTADLDFYMQRSGTGNQTALKIEIAGNKNINQFGWYDIANRSGYASNVIFNGGASAGAATFYAPSANYGFWFTGDDGTYFTQSAHNTAGGTQQFAIFQQSSGVYWLAMEDRDPDAPNTSDYDYNDMVVKISAVPDGGMTLMLLGGALVGLETLRRRIKA